MNFLEKIKDYRLVDLTHTMEIGMPVWPTHPQFYQNEVENHEKGEDSYLNQLSFGEHCGTHVDAPVHFIKGGKTIADVNPLQLFANAVLIDMSHVAANKTLSAGEIKQWELNNRPIEQDDIVIFYTGYQHKWALRPHQQPFLRDWPGLSREAAQYLADKKIRAVGTDVMTVEAFIHDNYPAHDVFLSREILIIENLTNLDKLPPSFIFIALPLKIAHGSASPIRAIALC